MGKFDKIAKFLKANTTNEFKKLVNEYNSTSYKDEDYRQKMDDIQRSAISLKKGLLKEYGDFVRKHFEIDKRKGRDGTLLML